MAHTVPSIDRATRRKCRQIVTLARRYERGANIAAANGRLDDACQALLASRSLARIAGWIRCDRRGS